MPDVFSRPTFGPHAALREDLTARVGGTTARLLGVRATRGSLILVAMIALATFTVLAEARAQNRKARGKGEAEHQT